MQGATVMGLDEKGGILMKLLVLIVFGGLLGFYVLGSSDIGPRLATDRQKASGLTTADEDIGAAMKDGKGSVAADDHLETGLQVVETAQKIDEQYRISDSAKEVARIAEEKYSALNEKYDLEGQATDTLERIKAGARKFNAWLKNQ